MAGGYACSCPSGWVGNGWDCVLVQDTVGALDPEKPDAKPDVIDPRDPAALDVDEDGLSAAEEAALGTDPQSADTDGDGLSDGDEVNGTGPLAGYGATDPTTSDTDGDGLNDGLEVGVGDDDPNTTTDPGAADTDGSGLWDGAEDANQNGRVDDGESDPAVAGDDCPESAAHSNGWSCVEVGTETNEVAPDDPPGEEAAAGGVALRGGGCQGTPGDPGSGSAAVVLLCLVGLMCARRRESVVLGLLLVVSSVAAPAAQAQDGALVVEQYSHLPGATSALNQSYTQTLPHLGWSAEIGALYVHRPLRMVPVDAGARSEGNVVAGQVRLELLGAIGLMDFLQVELGIPMAVNVGEADYTVGSRSTDQLSGAAAGDIRLAVGFDVIGALPASAQAAVGGLGVGFRQSIWIPSGDADSFNGEGSVRAETTLVIDYQVGGGWRVGTNLAWHFRERSQVFNVVNDDAFRWGAFARGPVGVRDLELMASVFGSVQLADQMDPLEPGATLRDGSYDPIEVLGGVSYRVLDRFQVQLAAGAGVNGAIGAPGFRVLTQLGYVADRASDADHDGIEDAQDACEDVAEDRDGFEDTDGCPEQDNDRDGLVDSADRCPNQAEDLDGFEDGDGCPDFDHDGDGLAEGVDKCPLQAEDVDGFQDGDGCPDPDNDRDGVLDTLDRCPMAKEDIDGFQDGDGCPDPDDDLDGIVDAADPCPRDPKNLCRALKRGNAIVIYDRVRFQKRKASIQRGSFGVLNAVAAILKRYPEVRRVEVEGHTDADGSARRNRTLSQARAAAVVAYLVSKGIDGQRLRPVGYGPDRPVVRNSSAANKQKNRRVQFVIQ